MNQKIELLAPGGDIDSIKAAIIAGANAVYCGLDKFNARNRAENIDLEKLTGIIRLAHEYHCEVFLTLNVIIVESEIPTIIKLLNKLINSRIDGLIVQDLGLMYLLKHYFPSLEIHASTQLTTHNRGQIKFLKQLNANRFNLSRELNLDEIKPLAQLGHEYNMLTEVFVHGSNCVSFSGLCYMSSLHGGNSGNRGRCSQPCREQYLTTAEGVDFPLNIKDNSAYSDLDELVSAGVDSVKIEGRIKKYHYVHSVVSTWRTQLDRYDQNKPLQSDKKDLRQIFNRDFSSSFLKANISKETFIDNPRDHSAIHRSEQLSKENGVASEDNLALAKSQLYDIKTVMIDDVKLKIDQLSIDKIALSLNFSGKVDEPLRVKISSIDQSFELFSENRLKLISNNSAESTGSDEKTTQTTKKKKKNTSQHLNAELIMTRLKAINESEYYIEQLDLEQLESDLFIPFKELTEFKKKILFRLNNLQEFLAPIQLPKLSNQYSQNTAKLGVLISSIDDVNLLENSDLLSDSYSTNDIKTKLYFELPNSFSHPKRLTELVSLFTSHPNLIPWFPAVLIAEDYDAAIDFLVQVKPQEIVSNNTGIAFEAYQRDITWIAGPFLNLVNSYSLLCLQEEFNCAGAFISNELSKDQIRRIKKPENFDLYYSIYHHIVLMTTRACIFHQVTGCNKNLVDDTCIQRCNRTSSITNLNEVSTFINKSRGNLHHLYNESSFLNTSISLDLPNTFSNYFIDLRDIETKTATNINKLDLITLFQEQITGDELASNTLQQEISPSTKTQYQKGI